MDDSYEVDKDFDGSNYDLHLHHDYIAAALGRARGQLQEQFHELAQRYCDPATNERERASSLVDLLTLPGVETNNRKSKLRFGNAVLDIYEKTYEQAPQNPLGNTKGRKVPEKGLGGN